MNPGSLTTDIYGPADGGIAAGPPWDVDPVIPTSTERQCESGESVSVVGLPVPFWEYWTSPEKVAMALTIYLMVG